MKTIADIFYTEHNDTSRSLDIYLPEDKKEEYPVFVYFHGGGLESGDKGNFSAQAKTVTDAGIGFISVNYRMYPNAKYPDFIEDAADSVKWTIKNINKYCNCSGVYVGGSSAGGYLSMMLCFAREYLSNRGIDAFDIKGYLHDAGQPTKHFNVLREYGEDTRRVVIDETAPLYYVGLEEQYPRMHFIVSDNDMQNRYEQTMLILSTLRHFGFGKETFAHTVMNSTHCAYVRSFEEDGTSIFGKMVADFIKKCEEA